MIDLSIIIVSYNTKDFLRNCIESIVKNKGKLSLEIIVVDNNSTDGTVEAIKNENIKMKNDTLELKIITNKENVGFSKANNIGIKQATGSYILFLNPDTIVHPFTLEEMIEFMENHKETGAATCRVELQSGALDDASHRGFPTPWNSFAHFSGLAKIFPTSRIFSGYSLGWENLSRTHEIDACAGAFMIVRRKAGEEIDWWDEDFFFYGEDLDFCYRLKEKGWKIYFVPDISILHYKGISGGIKRHSQHLATADMETKKRSQKARFDAMRIFYNKHYKKVYPKIVTWLVMKGIALRSSLFL